MKRYLSYVSGPALYAFGTGLILLIFSELWRLLVLFFMRDHAQGIPWEAILESFWVGARFDFKIVSTIVLILFVLGGIPGLDIVRSRLSRKINYGVLSVLTAILFFIHLADIEFFMNFNARLNGSALMWNDTPGDTVAMVWSSFPVVRYLLLYAAILGLFLFIMHRFLHYVAKTTKHNANWVQLVYIPAVLAVFVVGSIGRIYESTSMRWGMAYFSQYEFANLLALNPAYTFMRDAFYDSNKRAFIKHLVDNMAVPEAERTVRKMLNVQSDQQPDRPIYRLRRMVQFDPPNERPPSVILVIMESFGSSRIGCLKSRYPYDLTPGFDLLSKDGILFTNFYSSGTHTGIALFTIMSGTPHLIGKTMFKQVKGHTSYWSLSSILREKGYRTMFFTTQDPQYDNMQGFLRANGMMDISSMLDYDESEILSWLGVPDHIMFDHAYEALKPMAELDERYFAVMLSASHHHPYIIPDLPLPKVPEADKDAAELNTMIYSDWALTRFFRTVQADSSFDNTLFIITADNGIIYDPAAELDITMLQIPFFVYNTDWGEGRGERIDRIGCHFDILPSVMGLVRLDYEDYSFGKNLFDSSSQAEPFAFATSWYNVAFIQDSFFLATRADDLQTRLFVLSDKRTDVSAQYPEVKEEMLRKARSIYESAFYNQQLPLRQKQKALAGASGN